MTLRPYQHECDHATRTALSRSRSAMTVLPTGCGKTVVGAHLADQWMDQTGRKVLWTAHRTELVEQAEATFSRFTDRSVGVVTGQRKDNLWADVICAGKDSLRPKRLRRMDPHDYGLVVFDESHRSSRTNVTYQRIRDHFGANPDCRFLGLTATPDRTDGRKLVGRGREYDELAFHYPLWDGDEPSAIEDGWLVPPQQRHIVVGDIDYSAFANASGDWTNASIESVMAAERVCHEVARPTLELMAERPCIVFCSTVAHAEKQAEVLNRHRAGCAVAVSGKTPPDDRSRIMARFRRGEFQFLVNCDIATEGFDCDIVGGIVICRPTKSRLRFAQMVGRGTRTLKEVDIDRFAYPDQRRDAIGNSAKPDCLVLGFVGSLTDLKLTVNVDALLADDDDVVERVREYGGDCADMKLVKTAKKEVAAERLFFQEEDELLRAGFKPFVEYAVREVDPFAGGQVYGGSVSTPATNGVSTKQAALLVALGIQPATVAGFSKRQAGAVIDNQFGRSVEPNWKLVTQARRAGWTHLVGESPWARS